MKKQTNLLSIIFLFIITACSSNRIVLEDFEFNGNYSKSPYGIWQIDGLAFGNDPLKGLINNQNNVIGFIGKGYANSFHGGDDSTGSLLSYEFKIKRNYINFLIGGGTHSNTYIELLVNGNSIYKTTPIFPAEELNWMSWNVKKYKGERAQIRIVDYQKGDWGHILVDQIEMTDITKNTFSNKYSFDIKVRDKYLLLPMQDTGREYQLTIKNENKNISEPINIRLAESKIDYWTPINIEAFKGKSLSLNFDYMKSNSIGLKKIKQSNSFNYKYNEPTRPIFHFTAPYGWINDPNGMFWKDGEYHLYYQYNPYGTRWGNMHWGHAISKDLINWENLPVAMAPDSIGAIFSGSAVIDRQNTSGFGKDAIVAVYTSFKGYQRQSIAYSNDNGTTFTKYDKNPVLRDDSFADSRDPKVFWYEPTASWIMVLATGQTATLYASKDLKKWDMLSSFGEGIGSHAGVWECTDLFPLEYNGKQKWVLMTSITSGQQNADCSTQYYIGNFNGKEFIADPLPYPLWLDYGCDNYAGVTWNDAPDNRRIYIGWMANHYYAYSTPSINFRNAMSIPRELSLVNNGKHLVLASYPVKELNKIRTLSHQVEKSTIVDSLSIDNFIKNNTGAYDIEMVIMPESEIPFSITLSNSNGEKLSFTFDPKAQTVSTDRSLSGNVSFHPNFKIKPIISPLSNTKSYIIRLIIDKTSSELFVNNGEVVQSNVMYPSTPYNNIQFKSKDNKLILLNLAIYKMN